MIKTNRLSKSIPSSVPNSGGRFLAVALLLGLLTGCGDAPTGLPVHGQVTYQDQPVPGGMLTFYPSNGRSIATTVSPQGEYDCQLETGEYRVTLVLGVILPDGWKEGDPIPPAKLKLPWQYSSRLKTPLTATVTEGMTEPIDFPLK